MEIVGVVWKNCRAAFGALGRELVAWKGSRERALFGLQAVLSVGLAVLLSHALGLSHTWWAAITGFVVMRDSFGGCIERGFHRVLGSVVGAAIGSLIGPWIGDRGWLFVPLLALVGGYTVVRANDSKASYAWVLGGVTAMMVLYEAPRLGSTQSIFQFAVARVVEVVVGTLACVLVSGAVQSAVKRVRLRRAVPSAARASDNAGAPAEAEADVEQPFASPVVSNTRAIRLRLAIMTGIAVAIIAPFTWVFNLAGFAQAMVTVIALVILPADALAQRSTPAVIERMVQRVLGCLLAGVLGVGLLPLTHAAALPCMIALSLGIWVGCHVQTGVEGASYVGRQFTVAFIMVFVQDHQWSADPAPALMRLSGIFMGVVVLSAVMLAVRALPFRDDARTGAGGWPQA